ncbi:hypothetical protein [Herbaspirillum autotrophicum]|uniref:hypothetical protein n=1 Tax=Herbaspirillum autotrophicum TaxID=180195 RepID=UPI00067CA266|nr:hypothetical protein [Herbaspirillum autotrophicum]
MSFNLEEFEYKCYRRETEAAARDLLDLLLRLDQNLGHFPTPLAAMIPSSLSNSSRDVDAHLLSRVVAACSALLADTGTKFNPEYNVRMFTVHRWLSTLFSASPFGNADHILRSLNLDGLKAGSQLAVAADEVSKFCMLYTPESDVPLDLDALWAFDKNLAVSLCIGLISPRFIASRSAHAKREAILPWLTEKLLEVDDIEDLPYGVTHDLYMHCSYADRPDKHAVKKSINRLIRKKLDKHGVLPVDELPSASSLTDGGKPVMLIVLEWFTADHSIFRTHSKTMEAARKHFHVVGLGYEKCTDELTRKTFDEFIALPSGSSLIEHIEKIRAIAVERSARILYMPSVGMFPLTMFLSNLRVAPLQLMALGHPATTHSDCIDGVVVEEDYVGSPACFSEPLVILPADGMPYRASSAMSTVVKPAAMRLAPEEVKIAVCATTMKINPGFLDACVRIVKAATVPVHFHFLVGQAQGLVYLQVERTIRKFLGDACTIYRHQPYKSYMDVIANCDMYINPFPFGNTNGIIDTTSAGLVGICKTGDEVHEHIDQGLFQRLGLPTWLVATTVDEYVESAARLASDHSLRYHLREKHSGPSYVERFFEGRAGLMGERFLQLLTEKEQGVQHALHQPSPTPH